MVSSRRLGQGSGEFERAMPKYPETVLQLLGESRATALQECLRDFSEYAGTVPSFGSAILHRPIPLGQDPQAAVSKLVQRLKGSGSPDWFFMTAVGPDGSRVGYTSDVFRSLNNPPQPDDFARFFLFDLHSSLEGWWLTHVWRAADLADVVDTSLRSWLVIPAAACARALLEGVAAFVEESEQLLDHWTDFKKGGRPSLDDVQRFRDRFLPALLQARFGSRIGERDGTPMFPAQLKRTNVMTLLDKFAKRVGPDLMDTYDWLCDAVHPSFGFGTAYIATQGTHKTGATIAADLARRTDEAKTRIPKIDATVACAAADAMILSLAALVPQARMVRWFVEDMALTSGLAGVGSPQSPCACGSGVASNSCLHAWGTASLRPPV